MRKLLPPDFRLGAGAAGADQPAPDDDRPTSQTVTHAQAPGHGRLLRLREVFLSRLLNVGRRIVRAPQDDELDAAVLGPAGLAVLRAHRLGLAVAVRLQALALDAVLDHVRLDGG